MSDSIRSNLERLYDEIFDSVRIRPFTDITFIQLTFGSPSAHPRLWRWLLVQGGITVGPEGKGLALDLHQAVPTQSQCFSYAQRIQMAYYSRFLLVHPIRQQSDH